MEDDFVTCLAFTLRAEGGYVDNPDDPGGATNMGITLATYRTWSDDPAAGIPQIKDMTTRVARTFYRALYGNPLRADALPAGIDLSVFDFGVNAGTWRSARLLQRALGFTGDEVDGCIGPETLGAAGKADARTLIESLSSRQAGHYRSRAGFPSFWAGGRNPTAGRREAAPALVP